MICLVGNRPVLQIGRHQVSGYDTAWLHETIMRGAVSAKREDFPFIEDLIEGIVHYLENKCSLRVLTIEDLHTRIRRMLERIGCQAIASKMPLIAPPVTLSLTRAAKEAGNGFELAFFNNVHDEIEELRIHGVEDLYFTGTRDCVKILRGVERWTSPCEQLHSEILDFLKTHGHSSLPNQREIRLNLA